MRNKIIFGSIFLLLVIASICGYIVLREKNKIYDTSIASSSLNKADESINWDKYEGTEMTLTESISITKGGVYYLTGTIEAGYIKIDTDENVKLVLNNVTIKNLNGPAIYVENAENVVIELKEGTTNYLEDSSTYEGYEDEVDGVIFSKDDLFIEGSGTLEIKANHGDGIVSKDDLKISSGTYIINSKDDGIRGTDSVYIVNGSFTITSGGDAIKSTKENDSEKGYIYIENGTFKINSTLDGIQAQTKLVINDGTFDITTSNGVSTSTKKTNNADSAKGLKADTSIEINGGTYTFNTLDDSIHSNGTININGGTFNIKTGDDAVHADDTLVVNKGTIKVESCYEGLEATYVYIKGGNIDIYATNDGINAAGGATNGQTTENNTDRGFGNDKFKKSSNGKIEISGGTVKVLSAGDAIDANGTLDITGGIVYAESTNTGAESALDHDGTLTISGGEVIAVSASFGAGDKGSETATQTTIIANLTSSQSGTIKIGDISYTPSVKNYKQVIISSKKLSTNKTYTLYTGNSTTSVTTSNTLTTVGTAQSQGGRGNMQKSDGNNVNMQRPDNEEDGSTEGRGRRGGMNGVRPGDSGNTNNDSNGGGAPIRG